MCKSDGEAAVPLRLASMTRRHASMVASSPRSFAASRATQAASEGLSAMSLSDVGLPDATLSASCLSGLALSELALSDLGSSEILPKRAGAAAPKRIAFITNVPPPISHLNAYDAERGDSYWFQPPRRFCVSDRVPERFGMSRR